MTDDHFETISPDQLALATGGDASAIAQRVGNVGEKIQKISGIVQTVISMFHGPGAGAGAAPQPTQGGCPGGNCGSG